MPGQSARHGLLSTKSPTMRAAPLFIVHTSADVSALTPCQLSKCRPRCVSAHLGRMAAFALMLKASQPAVQRDDAYVSLTAAMHMQG